MCDILFELSEMLQAANGRARIDSRKMVFMFSRIFAYKRRLNALQRLGEAIAVARS